ncbi:hypothetical protein Z517_09645 [Fonsecaea pedrosoi CBS 271.37]|uniref:Uncharacterized protein n=1 Tax=Fonsecaea pedrosoi CBS 271.37 TaxID=1442368 RepID=A0A0D2GXT6_9EURO|nr:uncharacterized protein Z517_09645 [Fonsecaea pedrosoi CBS 271.37]KIW77199.1 hypothetical protein Z517_09645 [Fonsecaea pedrosoi CBS 271.37]
MDGPAVQQTQTPPNNNSRTNRGQRHRRRGGGGPNRPSPSQPETTVPAVRQSAGRPFGGRLTRLHAEAPPFVPSSLPPPPQSSTQPNDSKARPPHPGHKGTSARTPQRPQGRKGSVARSTAPDIATRIHEDISHNLYECAICTNEIGRSSKTPRISPVFLLTLAGRRVAGRGRSPNHVHILAISSVMRDHVHHAQPWAPSRVATVASRKQRDDVSRQITRRAGAAVPCAATSCHAASTLAKSLVIRVSVARVRLRFPRDATVEKWKKIYYAKTVARRGQAATGLASSIVVNNVTDLWTAEFIAAKSSVIPKMRQYRIARSQSTSLLTAPVEKRLWQTSRTAFEHSAPIQSLAAKRNAGDRYHVVTNASRFVILEYAVPARSKSPNRVGAVAIRLTSSATKRTRNHPSARDCARLL